MDTPQWVVHPARSRPAAAVGGLLVVALVSVAAALFGGDWTWGACAAFVLLLVLNRFYLPTRVELSPSEVVIRHPLWDERIRYADVARFAFDATAGLLSRARRVSRFARGGPTVPFDTPARADELRARLPAETLIVDARGAAP